MQPAFAFRHKDTREIRYTLDQTHNEDKWEDVVIMPYTEPASVVCEECHGDPEKCDIHDCGDAHRPAPQPKNEPTSCCGHASDCAVHNEPAYPLNESSSPEHTSSTARDFRPVGAAPLPDTQLCQFYGVDNFPDLVAAMEKHIEKLQAKLPSTPSLWPGRVREG